MGIGGRQQSWWALVTTLLLVVFLAAPAGMPAWAAEEPVPSPGSVEAGETAEGGPLLPPVPEGEAEGTNRTVPVAVVEEMVVSAGTADPEPRPAYGIYVNDVLVWRIRTSLAGLEARERAFTIAGRLEELLGGEPPTDVKPVYVHSMKVAAVTADETVIVTVDDRTAALNNSSLAGLTLAWANNLRAALGLPPLANGSLLVDPDWWLVKEVEYGYASWYGPGFHGRYAASGERFDQTRLTAAHRTLPFGTMVRVVDLDSGRSVLVRINDRGPWQEGRVIDLSRAAAQVLGPLGRGVWRVRLDVFL